LGLNIRADTMSNYLTAAAALYTDKDRLNPFRDSSIKKNCPSIILKALKKYEKVANRREVITDSMFSYVDKLASKSRTDDKVSVMNDFFKWARYSGPRRSEWCSQWQQKYDRVNEDPEGEALALISSDLEFYSYRGILLDARSAPFSMVEYVIVRWRFQKNEDHGEKIKYYRAQLEYWCPCFALWRVIQRAIRLRIPDHEPIAQYINKKGKRLYIRDKDVSDLLKSAATAALGVTDKATLSRWTSHSLRVTAANELHRLGFNGVFIQQRLRWRSDTFMKYLRNTIHVARQHTEAMCLSASNLSHERLLEPSNLEDVNKRRTKLNLKECVYRTPSDNDILWQDEFMAVTI
jgi:hypothetical protein